MRTIDDPDADFSPQYCVSAEALLRLASRLLALNEAHRKIGGRKADEICLRRLESSDGAVVAHCSSGPSVGGERLRLEYRRGKWVTA